MYRRTLIALLLAVASSIALAVAPADASPRGTTSPGVTNGQIAFDRFDPASGNQFIFTANPDGSFARQLVPAPGSFPGWSHDGRKLAFPAQAPDGRLTTATANADGSDYTVLPIDDPTLNAPCARWAPNDAQLACEGFDNTNPNRAGIYTISSADGSNLTRVTNPLGGVDEPGSFSPNGKQIVFARFDPNNNPLGLFVVNIDGSHLRRITPLGTIIQGGNDGDWSPQGNEIIFSRHVTSHVFGSIWVINADGSGLHEIHIKGLDCGAAASDPNGFGCHEPQWSPDGKKFIFAANSQATGTNIYTANADGTGLTQVTHDGGSDDPVWGTHPLAP
jgi:Tol biopolymer transport system component